MRSYIKKIIIAVVVLLLVVAFVVYKQNKGIDAEKITVGKGDILETVEGDGIVKSNQSSKIFALGNKPFQIEKIFVKIGDKVKKGDLLFTTKGSIDTGAINSIGSQIAATEVQYKDAKDFADKMERLHGEGVVSQQDLNKANLSVTLIESQKNQLYGQKETVVENSMPTEVRAYYDGEIVGLNISEGEKVMPQSELAEIAATDDLYIETCLAPKDAKNIKENTKAYFKDDKKNLMKIQRIHPKVENRLSDVGIMEKKVVVDIALHTDKKGVENKIIGMEDDIKFIINERKDVLLLPKRAVFLTKDGNKVYKLEDGKAYQVAVEIGSEDKKNYEIVSGIKKGDIVIVPPVENLKDGTKIN